MFNVTTVRNHSTMARTAAASTAPVVVANGIVFVVRAVRLRGREGMSETLHSMTAERCHLHLGLL